MRNVAVNGSPVSKARLRVLLVEDNDDHASLIARALHRARSARFVVERAATAAEALARVADGPWDAVVLDHRLGDTDGLVLLERLREAGLNAPTLLLVSGGSEALAIRARGAHVDDYMPKQEALREDVLARAVRDMQATTLTQPAPAVSPIRARAVVLVVEDDASVREVLTLLLEGEGYRVETAADGAAGLARIEAGGIDLVLLDLMLPALGGLELCRRVRSRNHSVYLPIIMLTALSGESQRHAGFAAGADDYLTKPFTVDEVLDRVRAWIHTRQRLVACYDAQSQLAAVVNSSADAIIATSTDGVIWSWNPAAERLYGYPDDAIIGKSLSVLIPSSSQEALDVAQEQLIRGERIEQYETRHVRADGREVEVSLSISPIHGPTGRVTGATLIARDVTERKQAEEALRDSETRYRGMIEATFDGVAIHQDGVMVDVNQGFCDMFGCERSQAIGRSVLDFIAEEAREAVLRNVRAGLQQPYEAVGVRRDGSRFDVEVVGRTYGPAGKGMGVTALRDITQRKAVERQRDVFAQTEKLRAIGQMASGVAHDLNQYLGLIAGHSELALNALNGTGPDGETLHEALRIVHQAAMDGADTVKRLQTFARPRQEAPVEQFDVGVVLRDVAQLTAPRWRDAAQAEGRPISLYVEVEDGLRVQGSPESLREAFTNLVFNAVDALPDGGRIRLSAHRRGADVEVAIADSGTGISPEVRERVFEPFFTTKGERGTGLGLSMVFGVVERHGGQIRLDTAPGQGTTFYLTFPAASEPPPAAVPTRAGAAARPLRILAVDDQPSMLILAQRMLAQDGHTVVVATSGEEALERLAAEPFDLVISDVGMGAGMNGWQLAQQVHGQFQGVRFALATGWGGELDPEQARTLGVEAIVAKPYRVDDLRRLVAGPSPPPGAAA